MYSEEEILLVSSEDREEQKEENSQSLQGKFSSFHHASICFLKFMLDSKINNQDIEKDISIS
jgi:hypothetical protein